LRRRERNEFAGGTAYRNEPAIPPDQNIGPGGKRRQRKPGADEANPP
jgi:hypothetical protein